MLWCKNNQKEMRFNFYDSWELMYSKNCWKGVTREEWAQVEWPQVYSISPQPLIAPMRVSGKVHKLMKILSWNVTKCFTFQHNLIYSSHASSFSAAVLGSRWSKKSSTVDMNYLADVCVCVCVCVLRILYD